MESTSQDPGPVVAPSAAGWFLGQVARAVARAWVAEHRPPINEQDRPPAGGEGSPDTGEGEEGTP